MKTELDLAPGVHRIEHAYTNCYVIADDESVTLVDAGFPSTGQAVIDCLTAHRPSDQRHQGPAADPRALRPRRLRPRAAPVARRAGLGAPPTTASWPRIPTATGRSRTGSPFPSRHPAVWPILGAMTAAGALAVRGVGGRRTYADGEVLARPGRPRAVHTPRAHLGTIGLPPARPRRADQRGTRWSPSTRTPAERGPRLVAPAATSDTRKAYAALDRIAGLEAPAGVTRSRRPLAGGHGVRGGGGPG